MLDLQPDTHLARAMLVLRERVTEKESKKPDSAHALRGMVKLIKAVHYYPAGHPSLGLAAEEAMQAFAPLLACGDDHLNWTVRKEGFLAGEAIVAPDNPTLRKLAAFLFGRRIHRLVILPDLSARDLRAFSQAVSLNPQKIQQQGGIQKVLREVRVSTVWVNEHDFSRILVEKAEIDALKGDSEDETMFRLEGEEGDPSPDLQDEASSAEQRLEHIIRELERVQEDQQYRILIQELVAVLPTTLTQDNRHLIIRGIALLVENASGTLSQARRELSLHALQQISLDEVFEFILDFLASRNLAEDTRQAVFGILAYFQDKVAPAIMERLVREEDAQVRKIFTEALVRQGAAAVPILVSYLADHRWYVVRNAVAIIGEIRDQGSTGPLHSLLGHKDVRVRRETIRALTRIGGIGAVEILLHTVAEGDQDLRRQALLSLGAMKHPAAVPTLLQLVTEHDPWVREVDVKKGAIKALGEIGSADAIPALAHLLTRRKFWGRSRFDQLRAAAAAALGDIGGDSAIAALEAAGDDSSSVVARAAVQALKNLRRGEGYEPGIS
jgi:HEAT repeat protein